MLVRYQAPIAEIRGKQGNAPGGDIVHSVAKGGRSILRTGFRPANPNTAPQQYARNLLNTLSNNYQALTANEAAAWRTLANQWQETDALGRTYKLDAMAMHNKVNTHRILSGGAYTKVAPALRAPLPPLTLDSLSVVTIDEEITVAGTSGNAANSTLARVRITPSLGSPVRFAQEGELRFLTDVPQYYAQTVANAFSCLIPLTRFSVAIGDYIGVEVQFVDATTYLPSAKLFVRNQIITQGA